MVYSFVSFLLAFTLIGVSSYVKSKKSKKDYYLASGDIKAWLVGLSAVATNNSGYMFIGVIGYTYKTGLASIWLMIGWILGDFCASLFIHSRLKAATVNSGEVTYSGVLSHWHKTKQLPLQRLIGVISLFFLLTYASAQLLAGSKALHVLFDWPIWIGAILGAILVAAYCMAGGIRASIWTDAAQSIVMIVAMALLMFVAIDHVGGVGATIEKMNAVDGFMDLFPKKLAFPGIIGISLFVISWFFAGLSVIGQPHVMVRFMTLNDNKNMRTAKIWYYTWFTAFYCMATAVGMLARIYLVNTESFDAELALPKMAQMLLHPVLAGLILAGIFAATMSTADSLIISCSSAITHDILPFKMEKVWMLKVTTVVITLASLGLALSNNQSVFAMVILSWSCLASAFAPLLIFLCFGGKPNQTISIIAVIAGFSTAIIWRHFGLQSSVYEGLPGIVAGLLILCLSLLFKNKSEVASSNS